MKKKYKPNRFDDIEYKSSTKRTFTRNKPNFAKKTYSYRLNSLKNPDMKIYKVNYNRDHSFNTDENDMSNSRHHSSERFLDNKDLYR